MITIIAACSTNRIIGKDNQLIWHIPDDLKRFKKLTSGNPILMGRKTYESIGRPLPNRTNIILTRDRQFKADGCLVYHNIEDVISIYHENLWVIGGSEIYKQFLSVASKIELTLVHKEFDGDSYFPTLSSVWIEEQREDIVGQEFDYSFITYVRSFV